jgi:tetrapyrrole methylase family protein/MazG family protein
MRKTLKDFVAIIKKLHGPDGCPWDRKQKIANYREYVIEEAYELVEAVDAGKPEAVKEELGDLLLQIVTLSHLYEQKGAFTLDDVIEGIANKMVARHPHVFAGKKVKNAEEVLSNWMDQKRREKQRKTLWERIPKNAPALLKSRVLFKEMKYTGKQDAVVFSDCVEKFLNDTDSMTKSDISELIFFLSYKAYRQKMDPEEALRERVSKEAKKHKY